MRPGRGGWWETLWRVGWEGAARTCVPSRRRNPRHQIHGSRRGSGFGYEHALGWIAPRCTSQSHESAALEGSTLGSRDFVEEVVEVVVVELGRTCGEVADVVLRPVRGRQDRLGQIGAEDLAV